MSGSGKPISHKQQAEATAPRHHCNAMVERIENVPESAPRPETPMFFTFPENAHWNAEWQAVEFGVEIGEYRGVVRVARRVFQRLLPERPPLSGAWKPTTSSGPGSSASPSGSSGGAS